MTVTQTIDIPENRRITLDIPREIPTGRIIIAFTAVSEKETDAVANTNPEYNVRDVELIKLNAEQLNSEAMDVLSYQNLDL